MFYLIPFTWRALKGASNSGNMHVYYIIHYNFGLKFDTILVCFARHTSLRRRSISVKRREKELDCMYTQTFTICNWAAHSRRERLPPCHSCHALHRFLIKFHNVPSVDWVLTLSDN